MPTLKKFLDQTGLILLLLQIEGLDKTNIKDLYWSTDNADVNPTVVFKVGDDNGSPHSLKKLTFKGETGTQPTGATARTLTITIGGVDKTITYYDTDNSTGISYSYVSDSADPTTATTVKAALDRAITALVNLDPDDEKVKLTAQTGNNALPILTAVSATPTSGNSAEAGYDTALTFNPQNDALTITGGTTTNSSKTTISAGKVDVQKEAGGIVTKVSIDDMHITFNQGGTEVGSVNPVSYTGKATGTENALASTTSGSEGATMVGYATDTTVKDALDEIYESIGDGGDLATRVTALEEGKEDKFFIISVTKSGNSFVKDKLDADIKAAYRAGKRLMVKYTTTSSTTVLLPLVYVYEPTLSTFVFQAPNDNFTRDIRAQIDGNEVSVTVVAYQSALTFDESPTANSDNPVKSGGVYSALQEKQGKDFFVKYVVNYGLLTNYELQIVSVDKTYAEVKEAYEQGKTLIGVFAYSGMTGENYLSLINTVQRDSDYEFRFTKCSEDGEVLSILMSKTGSKAYRALPHKVEQSPVSSNEDFPMLLAGQSGISSTKTTYTKYDTDLKYNPSTNTLKLGTGTLTATNYSGTAAQATADGSGNNIVNTYATKSALEALESRFTGSFQIVTTLPTADGTHGGIIYLIKDQEYGDVNSNIFKEYIEVNDGTTASPSWKFELLGTTDAGVDVVTIPATGANSVASMFTQYVKNA